MEFPPPCMPCRAPRTVTPLNSLPGDLVQRSPRLASLRPFSDPEPRPHHLALPQPTSRPTEPPSSSTLPPSLPPSLPRHRPHPSPRLGGAGDLHPAIQRPPDRLHQPPKQAWNRPSNARERGPRLWDPGVSRERFAIDVCARTSTRQRVATTMAKLGGMSGGQRGGSKGDGSQDSRSQCRCLPVRLAAGSRGLVRAQSGRSE